VNTVLRLMLRLLGPITWLLVAIQIGIIGRLEADRR
jgi:hypothetical protein